MEVERKKKLENVPYKNDGKISEDVYISDLKTKNFKNRHIR